MFLAAVLNAYLQPADAAHATPAIDLGASDDANVPEGMALARVRATPTRAEQPAGQTDARQTRARW